MESFPGEDFAASFATLSKHLARTFYVPNFELSQLVIFAIKEGVIFYLGNNLCYIYIELYYPHEATNIWKLF